MTKITFNRQEINWIERTADIETANLFSQFNRILQLYKDADDKQKELLNKQITELVKLYTFLKTLRAKLELWDCRYDTEINFQETKI